jgi:enterochelin esterase-like enzyme
VFAPDSVGFLIALLVLGVAALVALVRVSGLVLRLLAALVALIAVFVAGVAAVNVYFGYFTTWSDVTSGLGGGPAAVVVAPPKGSGPVPRSLSKAAIGTVLSTTANPDPAGTLLSIALPGARSRIDRSGYVWVPPQYREAAYAHATFPVLELVPGTPGEPADWVDNLQVNTVLAQLLAQRHIGPMLVVLAPSNPPVGQGHGEECTNKPIGAQDGTYIGRDIPADITAEFRADPPGRHWAIAGYSSGGYCAINVPLQHPGVFGAAADLDGYLSPLEDGGLWHVLFYRSRAALRANDVPAELALRRAEELPRLYLVAGSGNREDLDDLVRLRTLVRGRTSVTSIVDPGGQHTFRVWRTELPATLMWVWAQIGSGAPGL